MTTPCIQGNDEGRSAKKKRRGIEPRLSIFVPPDFGSLMDAMYGR
jgi:hypothetical protein